MTGIRHLLGSDFSSYDRNVNKEPEQEKVDIKTLDEARTYVAAQRFMDKTHARDYLEKLDGANDKSKKQTISLLKSAIQGEIKRLPERTEKAISEGAANKSGERFLPEGITAAGGDMPSKGKPAPSFPVTLRTFVVMNGLCSSQPHVDDHHRDSSSSAGWQSYRSAVFNQSEALDRVDSEHSGACAIFSSLWLKQIADRPSGSASSRMRFLDNAVSDVVVQQREYVDRVTEANQSSTDVEDPFYQTFRSIGIRSSSEDNLLVDVVSHEEHAMGVIADVLSRQNSSNFIWLARPDGCSAGGHVVAAHVRGDRVALFDPNLGEFNVRRSEIPTVMRAIIGDCSTEFPVPDVMIIPVHP